MSIWTWKRNGRDENGPALGSNNGGSADVARPALPTPETSTARARIVDVALADASDMAESLRRTAEQAESVATSGEQLASSANQMAASIEQMAASAVNLAASV